MDSCDKTSGSAAKAVFVIILFTVAGNILGLVRESTLAAYFGASAMSDAYKVAFTIPFILSALINAAINTTFIPVYTELKKCKHIEQVQYFVNNLFNSTAAVTLIITLAGIPSASWIINLVAPGFKHEAFNMAVKLTTIMLPSLIFLALTNLATGYLHSNNRFAAAALTGIPFNIFIIGSILMPVNKGTELVAVGSLLGISSQFFIQIPSLMRADYRPIAVLLDFKEEGLKKILKLSVPVIAGSAFNHLCSIIDKVLASGLDEGSISALDYASKVTGNINNLFIITIITVAFPGLASLFDDPCNFRATVKRIMKIVIFVSLPVAAGVFILRTPITRILFERGQFNEQDTHITSIALGLLSLSIVCSGIEALLGKAFYALKDTRTPVFVGVTGVCINIVLSFILVRFWTVGGLALASSLSLLIKSCILIYKFKFKVGFNGGNDIAVLFVKVLGCTSIMAAIVHASSSFYYSNMLHSSSLLLDCAGVLLNTAVGFITYTALMYMLRTEELKYFVQIVAKKGKS